MIILLETIGKEGREMRWKKSTSLSWSDEPVSSVLQWLFSTALQTLLALSLKQYSAKAVNWVTNRWVISPWEGPRDGVDEDLLAAESDWRAQANALTGSEMSIQGFLNFFFWKKKSALEQKPTEPWSDF